MESSEQSSSMSLWHNVKIKNVETLGEQSATGLKDRCGVLVVSVPENSELGQSGLHANDVILALHGKKVCNVKELLRIEADQAEDLVLKVWRNQTEQTVRTRFF